MPETNTKEIWMGSYYIHWPFHLYSGFNKPACEVGEPDRYRIRQPLVAIRRWRGTLGKVCPAETCGMPKKNPYRTLHADLQ